MVDIKQNLVPIEDGMWFIHDDRRTNVEFWQDRRTKEWMAAIRPASSPDNTYGLNTGERDLDKAVEYVGHELTRPGSLIKTNFDTDMQRELDRFEQQVLADTQQRMRDQPKLDAQRLAAEVSEAITWENTPVSHLGNGADFEGADSTFLDEDFVTPATEAFYDHLRSHPSLRDDPEFKADFKDIDRIDQQAAENTRGDAINGEWVEHLSHTNLSAATLGDDQVWIVDDGGADLEATIWQEEDGFHATASYLHGDFARYELGEMDDVREALDELNRQITDMPPNRDSESETAVEAPGDLLMSVTFRADASVERAREVGSRDEAIKDIKDDVYKRFGEGHVSHLEALEALDTLNNLGEDEPVDLRVGDRSYVLVHEPSEQQSQRQSQGYPL